VQLLGAFAWAATRLADRLDGIDGLLQDLRVMNVGRRVDQREWDAFSVDHDMALRALFAFICRILAGLLAPPGAGTLDESKDARSQSMWSLLLLDDPKDFGAALPTPLPRAIP
jgi:hypothetical protein